MKTKEIDGVLYKLVPEKENSSCEGCAFRGPDRSICNILTDDCNKGFIYKEANQPMSNFHLKPFNLEAAKAGKPVCTRDGRKARIICFDRKTNYPIIALIEDENGKESIENYFSNGRTLIKAECCVDLMMLPEKRSGWINIKKDGGIFKSREEAERNCSDNYVVVEVEWEE